MCSITYAALMIDRPSETLEKFSSHPNVNLSFAGPAKVLEANRGGLIIKITVADEVLEWFVDVLDGTTVVVQDWCDYKGYDDTPIDELARLMASDIEELVTHLLDRDIRLTATSVRSWVPWRRNITKRTLEWMVDSLWEQALPFPYD